MMNLTGDGNGFDMITMPREWRDRVPTSNFFQHSGYRDNPVAQRNNVVSKLIAATDAQMDEGSQTAGSEGFGGGPDGGAMNVAYRAHARPSAI